MLLDAGTPVSLAFLRLTTVTGRAVFLGSTTCLSVGSGTWLAFQGPGVREGGHLSAPLIIMVFFSMLSKQWSRLLVFTMAGHVLLAPLGFRKEKVIFYIL